MKIISEVGIRFLIGVFIAVLLGFLFWWFVVHTQSDRKVEISFQKFYNALDAACQRIATKENPEVVYIEVPQKTFANIFEEAAGTLGQIFGGMPTKTFSDPYYTFHWEYFPPEPPYEITDISKFGISGLPGTLAAIFIPWSEDLPWTSNLLITMGISSFFAGFDLLGIKQISDFAKKGYGKFIFELKKRSKILREKLKENSEILKNFIEGAEIFVEKAKVYVKFVKEKGKVIFKYTKEGVEKTIEVSKFVGIATLICLFTQDKTLEECLKEGIAFGVVGSSSYWLFKERAYPKIKIYIKRFASKVTQNIFDLLKSFKDEIDERIRDFKLMFLNKKDILEEIKDEIDKIEILKEKYLESINKKDWKGAKENLEEIDKKIKSIEEKVKGKDVEDFVFSELGRIKDCIYEASKNVPEEEIIELHAKGIIKIEELEGILDRLPEEIIEKPYRKVLISKGFKEEEVKELGKTLLVLKKEDNEEIFKDFEEYAKYYKDVKNTLIERIGDYRLFYDENGNLVKIVFDPEETLSKRFAQIFVDPIKNYIKILETKSFIHNELIDSKTFKEFVEEIRDEIIKNPNAPFVERISKATKMSKDEIMNRLNILSKKMEESIGIVIERNTKLAEIIKNAKEKSPREIKDILRSYFFEIVEKNDVKEIELFTNLLKGKELRIKEDLEVFFREGAIGYSVLRILDLYTPLGASYWDKLLSYYGYEGQKVPAGCQTSCEEGKICVQLGACFRQFDLPESCKKLGIESIKIERDSIVAKNPRFYLVSPCYGDAIIYIDSNEKTIFVKVLLDPKKQPNYCYAYKDYVNAYIATEIGEVVARCAAGVICGFGTIVNFIDGIKACIFGGISGICSLAVNIAEIGILGFREGLMVWPTVYQNFQALAEWKV
jgi:methyl-accepting chemotaxis protein